MTKQTGGPALPAQIVQEKIIVFPTWLAHLCINHVGHLPEYYQGRRVIVANDPPAATIKAREQ